MIGLDLGPSGRPLGADVQRGVCDRTATGSKKKTHGIVVVRLQYKPPDMRGDQGGAADQDRYREW